MPQFVQLTPFILSSYALCIPPASYLLIKCPAGGLSHAPQRGGRQLLLLLLPSWKIETSQAWPDSIATSKLCPSSAHPHNIHLLRDLHSPYLSEHFSNLYLARQIPTQLTAVSSRCRYAGTPGLESRCLRRAPSPPGRLRAPADSRRHCFRAVAAWIGEYAARVSRRLGFIERAPSPQVLASPLPPQSREMGSGREGLVSSMRE